MCTSAIRSLIRLQTHAKIELRANVDIDVDTELTCDFRVHHDDHDARESQTNVTVETNEGKTYADFTRLNMPS
jgi:hypothetical protein